MIALEDCELDIDLQISFGRDKFSVKGDHIRLVLLFPSVGCAVRVWRTIVKDPFTPVSEVMRGVGNTIVETKIRGFEVARYLRRSETDLIAKVFGFAGTQVRVRNLLLAIVSSFGQQPAAPDHVSKNNS